ncbi:MAG: glycosyltransferase family 2 protein, partial [Lentisphaeria bacterium]|nr:glycosyltransferase family 2 protein [Lentisphaeria bacterium]
MEEHPEKSACAVICVYDNGKTLRDVVTRTLAQKCAFVLVVDDGSGDCDVKELLSSLPVTVLAHSRNRGKGAALRTAMDHLSAFPEIRWMVTLDADGQHFPEDIPLLLSGVKEKGNEKTFFIGTRDFGNAGNIPERSVTGRNLSNVLVRLETGRKIPDTQCGMRVYPLPFARTVMCSSGRYEWETEILVRAAWAGAEFFPVPVRVEYFTPETRVSHFRVFRDVFRFVL